MILQVLSPFADERFPFFWSHFHPFLTQVVSSVEMVRMTATKTASMPSSRQSAEENPGK